MAKIRSIFLLKCLSAFSIAACLVFNSCKEKEPVNREILERVEKRKNDPWNISIVDTSVRQLKTGDIVLRAGNDITSYMLRQLNQFDKTYSHCGLVMVENGYPFVYHSIGGEDNPDEILMRDSANQWLSPARNEAFGIVRLDYAKEKNKDIFNVVRGYYKEKKKFDMAFDISDDERFYCAEFVYKSFNKALNDSNYLKPATVLGYTFMGIDNLFLNEHARFICQIRFK